MSIAFWLDPLFKAKRVGRERDMGWGRLKMSPAVGTDRPPTPHLPTVTCAREAANPGSHAHRRLRPQEALRWVDPHELRHS